MSGRPINLPELPFKQGSHKRAELEAYARAAVEADRRGIVVTDEDVEEAWNQRTMYASLESFAKRLRGET